MDASPRRIALAAAGVEPEEKRFDQDILYGFSYLWLRGYLPKLQYRQEVWRNKRTPEDMAAWCMDRAKLRRRLEPADEEAVRDHITRLNRTLPLYKRIAAVEFSAEPLPRTAVGKLQRK